MRSAASSPAVAPGRNLRARSATRPRPRRRGARLTVRASVLITLVVGVLLLSIAPARMYFDQQAALADLERQAAALTRTNETLAARADQLRDDAFLERLARQCLGMVKPGEIAFVVVPKEGAPAPPPEC
ncbi:MAG: FtsB family cell division protein [Actinomycetota bacterium]